MEENKKDIVKKLETVLKATRAGSDIEGLELSEDAETIAILFNTGYKRNVNIAMDSGISIIRDVARAL